MPTLRTRIRTPHRTRTRGHGRSVVGLDIEPSYVAAAEVDAQLAVTRAGTAMLDPSTMRDGEVTDADVLSERLKELFGRHKLPKRVRVGVANQRIVVRTLDLPRLENAKELEAAIRFQAAEHVPMPLDQAVLDFHPLEVVGTPDGGERQPVLVVAARRDMVEHLLAAVRGAGLRPDGVDLSAFAMIRALEGAAPAGEGAVLYVHVGGLTNLAVASGSECRFTRVAGAGLETMVAELAARRGLTLEHSRQWLEHVGLLASADSVEGDEAIVADARSVLADGTRRVADEVRHSLDFYRASDNAVNVERAVVTGPAVGIDGFTEQLAADLGLPVAAGRASGAPGLDLARLSVAAGLAVEERPR